MPNKLAHKKYKVIVDTLPQDYPKEFEMKAAENVAQYFKTNIVFRRKGFGKSADLDVKGVIWEIKSPNGNSKNTIKNNINEASDQSKRIIIDLSRCDIPFLRARSRALHHLKTYSRHIQQVMVITKNGIVIEIFRRKQK